MPVTQDEVIAASYGVFGSDIEAWHSSIHELLRVPARFLHGAHTSRLPEPLILDVLGSYEVSNYDYAQVPNWDGKGAVALTHDVIRLADKLASEYASADDLVEVQPWANGSLVLTWEDESGQTGVLLAVGPKTAIRVSYKLRGRKVSDIQGDMRSPGPIRQLVRLAFQATRLGTYQVAAGGRSLAYGLAAITYVVGAGGGARTGNAGGSGGSRSNHAFGVAIDSPPIHPNCRSVARVDF